ncbi:response regulator transcription factor [Alkalihalobacterium sp. APHAB7]|uniref:response regulator transcription factor n=1 Tax=Alkalihalobacterium sp. APHAB7 TaxID=3402081 RepID=UPI003AAE71B0
MRKILIVEDDRTMGQMLNLFLEDEGYQVQWCSTGESAMISLTKFKPDIIVMDLILPDINGHDLSQQIQNQHDIPIIMISVETKSSERVLALNTGVDDFLCKPFNMKELQARIEAVLRRVSAQKNIFQDEFIQGSDVVTSPIELDSQKRVVDVRGEAIELTISEFKILSLFMSNPEIVFTRENLINKIKGMDKFVTDRSIDVHINNLRKKVEIDPKNPQHIRTVWGVGYKWTN